MTSLTLSHGAAQRVALIARKQDKPAILRLAVEGGGCSGFQYRFALEDTAQGDDLVIDAGAAKVFVDQVSMDLLAGSELDWNEALIGAHFTVKNPQAVSGCGCGASFAVA
jgi:iron-sulfur cluster assembly accessory protein